MRKLLDRLFPYKQLGWREIGEDFVRYRLLKTKWFQVLLHRLDAPRWHPNFHDHPWDFVTVILSGGYLELTEEGAFWRRPGSILFRHAEFVHNVVTSGVSWSLVITSAKRREWRFVEMPATYSDAVRNIQRRSAGSTQSASVA